MDFLRPEDFEPWVGRKVRLNTLPEPVELTLQRIERRPVLARAFDHREPFSLFFDGPMHVLLLDESYEFDCGKGGPYKIFINQLQPGPAARHYQAVFS